MRRSKPLYVAEFQSPELGQHLLLKRPFHRPYVVGVRPGDEKAVGGRVRKLEVQTGLVFDNAIFAAILTGLFLCLFKDLTAFWAI